MPAHTRRAAFLAVMMTMTCSSVSKADLLVGSHITNSILRYNETTGSPLGAFVPSASGGLSAPHGFAFGPDGNLYVTGHVGGPPYPSPVKRYNGTTGAYINDFVPVGGGGLAFGENVRWGPDGNLYVASWESNEVIRYNGTTGALLSKFSTGVSAPVGVAFGPDGMLYVSNDAANNVVRFNPTTGASLGVFVTAGSGGLNLPRELLFGPDNNLYVASAGTDSVLRYSGTTGAFIDAFVSAGSGGVDFPFALAFGPDGNLYVTSVGNERIQRYNGTTGAFIDIFVTTGSGGLSFPHNIAFTPPPSPPGITVAPSGGATNISEGGATDTYTIVLNTAPTANVAITLNPGTQVSVAPATLTFTPANWNSAQTVIVTAVDDTLVEGPHTATITHTAVSTDAGYNGIAVSSVTANIADNEVGPPPGPPAGGGEGSYAGSNGVGPQSEGEFGFGARARNPRLLGPVPHGPSDLRVFNVAHRSRMQAALPGEERHVPVWSIAVTAFVLALGIWLLGRKSMR